MRKLPLVPLFVVACSAQPTVVPVRNLERPSDMSFVCLRVTDTGALTGRPMTECHPHLVPDPAHSDVPATADPAPDFSNRTLGTFGLVPNTARGELAVVDLDSSRLVDLDPGQPGYNMEPLGQFPEVISATQDGCMAATANRGSCDLSVIDPQRLLSRTFGLKPPSTGPGPASVRVPVTGRSGPLHVAPQEIAFLPIPAAQLPTDLGASCQAGPFNAQTGLRGSGWSAVVTFPACDLVAVVELPSGKITSSVYIRPEGVVDAGDDPVCPVECGLGLAPQPSPDAGAVADAPVSADMTVADAPATVDLAPSPDVSVTGDAASIADATTMTDASVAPDTMVVAPAPAPDAGAAPGPLPVGPFRIGALAIRPQGDRLYVGGENAPFVTAVDIVSGALRAVPDGGRIPLHEGPIGVNRLRLSVDPFEIFKDPDPSGHDTVRHHDTVGHFLGAGGAQFLYAFARDNSVRVLDANFDPLRNLVEHECDVNLDLQFGTPPQPCAPEIEDPAKRPIARRAFTQGPGLRLPTILAPNQAPGLPRDISFASVQGGTDVTSGEFGYLLATNSTIYILNVQSLASASPALKRAGTFPPPANTFRNSATDPLRRWPAVATVPSRNLVLTDVPLPTHIALGALDGPRIEGPVINDTNQYNVLTSGNDPQPTWGWFPDPLNSSPQAWFVSWQGELPGTERARGRVQGPSGQASAGVLSDPGTEFCRVGALPKDLVLFAGCLLDTDCSVPDHEVCRQAVPGTPGMCLPSDEPRQGDLLSHCARHMSSRRRYEVTYASPTTLELGLKLDELPRPASVPCRPELNDKPVNDCQLPGFDGFTCEVVRPGESPRCVKKCGDAKNHTGSPTDSNCRGGAVCEMVPGSSVDAPLCVEGPPIDPACWTNGADYRVQAGNSFLVTGTATPTPPTTTEVPDPSRPGSAGAPALRCVPDLTRHQFYVNRIPLDAPHCANVKDEDVFSTVRALEGPTPPAGPKGTWGNPCLFWAENNDDQQGDGSGVTCGDPNRVVVNPNDSTMTIPAPNPCRPCALDPMTGRPPSGAACHLKAFFQNSQVRFTMTNLEVFGGDANIIRMDVIGGFVPDTALVRDDVLITAGARIVTGPTATPYTQSRYWPYIFVVDQGRTASSAAGRGQVLRLNPRAPNSDLPLFDSTYSGYPFQIQ